MKKKLLFAFILLVSIVFSACSKFEMGPSLTLQSKNKKLKGYWQKTTGSLYYHYSRDTLINGVQHIIHDSVLFKEKYLYHFRDNNNFSKLAGNFYLPKSTFNAPDSIYINDTLFVYGENIRTGDWHWMKNFPNSLMLLLGEDSVKWDILMLTDKELRAEIDPDENILLKKCDVKLVGHNDFPFK